MMWYFIEIIGYLMLLIFAMPADHDDTVAAFMPPIYVNIKKRKYVRSRCFLVFKGLCRSDAPR